jgi:hypothetical protein
VHPPEVNGQSTADLSTIAFRQTKKWITEAVVLSPEPRI